MGYPFTYFAPLAFVLSITISKEAYLDYVTYQRDREGNSLVYEILTENGYQKIASADLKVGHLVVINKNHKVPADCILMQTIDPSGTCFIRTDQLDGETDWKLRLIPLTRIAVPHSQKLSNHQALLDEIAIIKAESPNKEIHRFSGSITWNIQGGKLAEPLDVENVLWMNTVLASDQVLGCVLYTGSDTKAVMNTSFASTKIGLVDLEINQLSKILAVVTVFISFLMVALDGFKGLWYVYIVRFLILFSSIIPISLRVNLDMAKTFYAHCIMKDEKIKDTIVRTSTIPEELGRIDYLLTDKTGTLTKNGRNY